MKKTHQNDALSSIAEELPIIFSCILDAWQIYQMKYPEDLKIAHSATSRASIVHDHIVSLARQRFEPRFGVQCLVIGRLFIVSFNSGVVVRFKKFDKNFRAHNIRTRQSSGFMTQAPLPEIGEVINLQAGYRLDDLETDIEGIYLTLPISESGNEWVFELNGADIAKNNVTAFPKTTHQESKGIRLTKKGGRDANESNKS